MPQDERAAADGSPTPVPPRAASSSRRRDVLERLRDADRPLGIAELARDLEVHPNTVRFHLDALLDAGLVRRADSERGAPGRPALRFTAVPGMDRRGPRRYGQLARALAGALDGVPDGPARALEAGLTWGREAAGAPGQWEVERPVDALLGLLGLLDDLDFDPVDLGGSADGGGRIGLRRCPFLEVATTRSSVVCPVHLGLMQGAVQAWGADVSVRLQPFEEPNLCVAHLSGTGA